MGNLRNLLTNPMQIGDQVAALTEAVLLDEAVDGTGNLSGSLTAKKIPVASATHTLVDSHIDDGLTTASTVTVSESLDVGPGQGVLLPDLLDYATPAQMLITEVTPFIDGHVGTGHGNGLGIEMQGTGTIAAVLYAINAVVFSDARVADGPMPVAVVGSAYLQGAHDASEAIALDASAGNYGTGTLTNSIGLRVEPGYNGGGGVLTNNLGVSVMDQLAGTNNWAIKTGAGLVELGDNIKVHGVFIPGILYSAAGTALPDPTTVPGGRAVVSDATANVYGTAYASGGAITAPVYSDGAAWIMG